MRVAVMRAVVLALALAACAHGASSSSQPAAPADYPTLPPMSSTPIGLLLDQASSLALSGDQVTQLRKIDGDLKAKNDVIDGELADLDRPAHAAADSAGSDSSQQGRPDFGLGHSGQQHFSSSSGGPNHGGGHHGGEGGGGSGEHVPLPPPDAHNANQSDQARAMRDQQKANTQAALAQALQLLDAQQQVKARAVLTEHGYGPPKPPAELPAAEGALPGATTDAPPDEP